MGLMKIDLTPVGLMKLSGRGALFLFILSIVAVYILDMIFFGSIGDGWFLTIVFVLVGIVFRTGAVVLDVYLHYTKPTMGNTSAFRKVRILWWCCIIACLLSAINFFAAGHAAKGAETGTIEAVSDTRINSRDQQVAQLQARITRREADRDAALADISRQIEMIRYDDVPGISAADNANIAALNETARAERDAARTDIDDFEKQIAAIQSGTEEISVAKTQAEQVSDTWEVFVWLGAHTPLDSKWWSNSGLFFLAMLLEAIAAFGLGAYVALQTTFRRVLMQMEVDESVYRIEREAEMDAARIRAEALKAQLAARAMAEAGDVLPPAEPPEQPAPPSGPANDDSRDHWTKQQWDAHKGALARQAYEDARKSARLRMGPVSAFDVMQQEAAE